MYFFPSHIKRRNEPTSVVVPLESWTASEVGNGLSREVPEDPYRRSKVETADAVWCQLSQSPCARKRSSRLRETGCFPVLHDIAATSVAFP